MKKIIEWYKKSNRYKHAATGGIILAVFLLAGAVVAVSLWNCIGCYGVSGI